MTCTVWTDDDPVCDELTVKEGTDPPAPGHVLLHTIEAPDWVAVMTRYHELMGWEPYKPMT